MVRDSDIAVMMHATENPSDVDGAEYLTVPGDICLLAVHHSEGPLARICDMKLRSLR